MKDLKTILKWLKICAIALLVGAFIYMCYSNKQYKDKYEVSESNNKAFFEQLDNEKKNNMVFQLTIDQLQYYNDSITNKMLDFQKSSKIKDKQVESLQYLLTNYSKVDTLVLKDTIFKDIDFKIDTTIGDKWMNTQLCMSYPNNISLKPSVKSEKEVIIYTNKETINPPKKFFLCRWFQKKHTVTRVNINEENPYIENEENVFIKITK